MSISCLLCGCTTLETILEEHIQYNHMIYRASLIKALYNLHFPPIPKTNFVKLLQDLKNPVDPTLSKPPNRTSSGLSPRQQRSSGKRSRSQQRSGGSAKKLKVTDNEKRKPEGKKEIKLKSPTPLRKKLHPNREEFLDEDATSETARTTPDANVNFDDAYSRFEEDEEREKSIRKIRELQEKDLHCSLDRGTQVQCHLCSKWRVLQDCLDPSMVADVWDCSMNPDTSVNTCDKGESLPEAEDEDLMDVKFGLGSLVWAKFVGFPFWPGMVDYCPVEEDTFLVDPDVSTTEAAMYHVVFFDKNSHVKRSWVSKDNILRLTDPASPPTRPRLKSNSLRARYNTAKKMATQALKLDLIARVDQFSFANLYTGKWTSQANSRSSTCNQSTSKPETQEAGSSNELEVDPRLIGLSCFKNGQQQIQETAPFYTKQSRSRVKPVPKFQPPTFTCLKCSKSVRLGKSFVENHLKHHKLTLRTYVDIYASENDTGQSSELEVLRGWIMSEDYHESLAVARKRQASGEHLSSLIRRRLSCSPAASTPLPTSLDKQVVNAEDSNTTEAHIEPKGDLQTAIDTQSDTVSQTATGTIDDNEGEDDTGRNKTAGTYMQTADENASIENIPVFEQMDATNIIQSVLENVCLRSDSKDRSNEKSPSDGDVESSPKESIDNNDNVESVTENLHLGKPDFSDRKKTPSSSHRKGMLTMKKNLSQYKTTEVVIPDDDDDNEGYSEDTGQKDTKTDADAENVAEDADQIEEYLIDCKVNELLDSDVEEENAGQKEISYNKIDGLGETGDTSLSTSAFGTPNQADNSFGCLSALENEENHEESDAASFFASAAFSNSCKTSSATTSFNIDSLGSCDKQRSRSNSLSCDSVEGRAYRSISDGSVTSGSVERIASTVSSKGSTDICSAQERTSKAGAKGSTSSCSAEGSTCSGIGEESNSSSSMERSASSGCAKESNSSDGTERSNSSGDSVKESASSCNVEGNDCNGSVEDSSHDSADGCASSSIAMKSASSGSANNSFGSEEASLVEEKTEPLDSGFPAIPEFRKPHFSTDLLIALAIRNINMNVGAYMKDVIAFLCLFFPYYNNNRDECWQLVTRNVTGKARIPCKRNSMYEFIIEAGVNIQRMSVYANKFRCRVIRRSLIDERFLEDLIDRFINPDNEPTMAVPPYTFDMLLCLTLASLDTSLTLDQICVFLKFVFPGMAGCGVIESFKHEFSMATAAATSKDGGGGASSTTAIFEYMTEQQAGYYTTYKLKPELKDSVLEKLVIFTKDNYDDVLSSVRNPQIIQTLLPQLEPQNLQQEKQWQQEQRQEQR